MFTYHTSPAEWRKTFLLTMLLSSSKSIRCIWRAGKEKKAEIVGQETPVTKDSGTLISNAKSTLYVALPAYTHNKDTKQVVNPYYQAPKLYSLDQMCERWVRIGVYSITDQLWSEQPHSWIVSFPACKPGAYDELGKYKRFTWFSDLRDCVPTKNRMTSVSACWGISARACTTSRYGEMQKQISLLRDKPRTTNIERTLWYVTSKSQLTFNSRPYITGESSSILDFSV